MKIVLYVIVALALCAAYLMFWPVPIEPVAWTPQPAPSLSEGVYAYNENLKGIEKLAVGVGTGPEGVAIDASGRIYAGYADGRVMMFSPDGSTQTLLANTNGRPLGITFGPDGGVIVADAVKGLLLLDGSHQKTLAVAAEGQAFKFVDDADRTRTDQNIYFTDASARFGVHEVMADFLEHGATGRLLRHDLASGQTTVLMKDLHFPNGVAVGPDDAYLLVNETAEYRIWRYWLKGEKAGTAEVLIENLPGLPDNISFNGRDKFWVALYAPRAADLDRLLPDPAMRKLVYRLPDFLKPKPAIHAFVLALDLEGKVMTSLQYKGGDAYAPITSVEEHDGWLYFGSLSYPALGRMRVDAAMGGTPLPLATE